MLLYSSSKAAVKAALPHVNIICTYRHSQQQQKLCVYIVQNEKYVHSAHVSVCAYTKGSWTMCTICSLYHTMWENRILMIRLCFLWYYITRETSSVFLWTKKFHCAQHSDEQKPTPITYAIPDVLSFYMYSNSHSLTHLHKIHAVRKFFV